jgi:peptidoglycan/LPS O-acetylase OafA/YrhL
VEEMPKKNEQKALAREALRKQRWLWTSVYAILVALMYVLPYTVLKDVPKVYGSFTAWWVLGLGVILVTYYVTSKWRD